MSTSQNERDEHIAHLKTQEYTMA